MKSTYVRARNIDTNAEVHQILTYDDKDICVFCDRPVGSASTSGTAICPQCDTGASYRQGIKQRRYPKGSAPSPWRNVKEHWEFSSRPEAERKMYELHMSGIEGWFHIIRKFTGKPCIEEKN